MLSFSRTEGDGALDVIVIDSAGEVLDVELVEGRCRGDGPVVSKVLLLGALACAAPLSTGRILADNAADLQEGQLAVSDRKIDTATLRALLDDPSVPDLKRVRAASNRLDGESGVLLAGHAHTRALVALDLGFNEKLGPSGVRALAGAPLLATLVELRVPGTGVDGGALTALGAPAALGLLEASFAPVGDDVCNALRAWPVLERLYLRGTRLTGAGVTALTAHPTLILLDVEGTPLGAGALSGLLSISPSLRSLGLEATGLGPSDVAMLAAAASRLETLDLSRNPLGDAGVEALAASPLLRVLRGLELVDVGATPAARGRLRAAWGARPGLTL